MELERTPIISIRTGEAVKSVKELKQTIADLRDEIVRLRGAEQDTTQAEAKLASAQRELNTVNGLTKKSVEGVEGSYNDLAKQLKEANELWKSLPQTINGEVNPAYIEARDRVASLRSDLNELNKSVGDYRMEVGHYQNALEGVSGIAGQLSQGITSLGTTFGLCATQGSLFGDSMKGIGIAIKGITIAASVLKSLQKIGDTFKKNTKETTANTTSTKANTNATKQNTSAHITNTVAEGAETTATWTLKGAIDALKASLGALGGPFTVIITLATTLISLLPDLISWIGKLGKGSDEASAGLQQTVVDPLEQIQIRLEQNNRDREHALSIAQKEKRSEQEIYELKLENAKQERQDYLDAQEQARQVLTQKTLEGNKLKENSEEWKKNQEAIENARKAMDEYGRKAGDLNWQIAVGIPETYKAEQTGQAKQDAEKKAEEARKNAEQALKEAQKTQADADKKLLELIESTYDTDQKISAKYKKLYDTIEGYYTGGQYTQEQYNQATAILHQQETDELRLWYKQRFETEQKGWNDSAKVLRQQEDETREVYKGLSKDLRGTVDAEKALYEEEHQIRKTHLEQDLKMAKEHLRRIVSAEDQTKMAQFDALTETREGIIALYTEMLANEDEFANKFPEPFITALKSMGPLALQYNTETGNALKQHVDFLMRAYEEAVEKNDINGAKLIRDALLGDPPIADDATLQASAQDFVNRMDRAMAESLINSENPLEVYLKGSNWDEQLGIYLQKYRDILTSTTATEAQQYEARIKILEAYNQKYKAFIDSYGTATSNVLSATGDMWEALLQRQVKTGKKSEEEAKKSFKGVKALQYATAVISTAGAVTQALADPTVPSYYVKVANAVAALATGTAQILKIANTDFSASGGGGGAETSAPTAMQRSSYVPTVGLNSMDYADAQATNPVRAYIVDRDLNEGMDRYNTRQSETTF